MTRQGLHDRLNKSEDLRRALEEIREELRDMARGNIFKALREGDYAMTRFYAERQMRDEYGPRVKVEGDTAAIERLADAIASGGESVIRAVQAALAGSAHSSR
jgi:hypothetical protein